MVSKPEVVEQFDLQTVSKENIDVRMFVVIVIAPVYGCSGHSRNNETRLRAPFGIFYNITYYIECKKYVNIK
jgi:hypothetical protein